MKLCDGKLELELRGSDVIVSAHCTPEVGLLLCATAISDLTKLSGATPMAAMAFVTKLVLGDVIPDVAEIKQLSVPRPADGADGPKKGGAGNG